jgi:hypothetical protein
METFVRYTAFVNDKIEPNKAYVDTRFTEKWQNSGQKTCAIPCKGYFQHLFLINKWKLTRKPECDNMIMNEHILYMIWIYNIYIHMKHDHVTQKRWTLINYIKWWY